MKIEESRLFFIDNGFSQNIPKMFEPRGSFCIYTKELIDKLPDNFIIGAFVVWNFT